MNELTFISCIRFSLQLMFAEGVLVFYMDKKKNFILRLLLSIAGYFAVAFVIFHSLRIISQNSIMGEIFYYFSLFVVTLLLLQICFDISAKEILFAGIGGYAIQHLAFNIAQITDYLFGDKYGNAFRELFVYVIPYLIIPFIVYWFAIRKYREDGELKDKDIKMTILGFANVFVTVILSLLARKGDMGAENAYLRDLICNIYSMICCSMTLFILFYIPKENRLKHEQEMLEQVIHVMGEQQQMSKESIEIINRKCHDIKHQLNALNEIESPDERKRFTDEIRKEISIYDTIYQTGNTALDFVLREKSLICREYNIKFSCMTDGKLLNFMETLDICVLFGNALDNAIESVMKEKDDEKRLINMHILKREHILHIHIDNYCNEEIKFENNIPVTSKGDNVYHGFGVKSICHIAEKYDGDVSIKTRNDRFILDILIPIYE